MVPKAHASVALRPLLGRSDFLWGVLWAAGVRHLLYVGRRRVARMVLDLRKRQQSRLVEENAEAYVDYRGTVDRGRCANCVCRYA